MAIPIQVVFDCADPPVVARFWADALGYQLQGPPGTPPAERRSRVDEAVQRLVASGVIVQSLNCTSAEFHSRMNTPVVHEPGMDPLKMTSPSTEEHSPHLSCTRRDVNDLQKAASA